MKVTQITIGRFHHFHLARQMQRFDVLDKIYTGYPKFKLKDEKGIPEDKIASFPWVHGIYRRRKKLGIERFDGLVKKLIMLDIVSLDKYVAVNLKSPTILISLSGSGLGAGIKNQKMGGVYICDRGSTHIKYQDDLLREEYNRWNLPFIGNDPQIMKRAIEEYDKADFITVPSKFVYDSFIHEGISPDKLHKIPYGANIGRFSKVGEPEEGKFRVLWVGGISVRKGFLYALEAFEKINHPNKEFLVIGKMSPEMKDILERKRLDNVVFKGFVPNTQLAEIYSTSNVFVLPSLEEGLAMVQGESLACGCPIIATPNTGAEDLFTDNEEGFIVPIRNAMAIKESFEKLIDTPMLRQEMSVKAQQKVNSLGGWDTYGDNFKNFIQPYL